MKIKINIQTKDIIRYNKLVKNEFLKNLWGNKKKKKKKNAKKKKKN